jgi:hypothetical protein
MVSLQIPLRRSTHRQRVVGPYGSLALLIRATSCGGAALEESETPDI